MRILTILLFLKCVVDLAAQQTFIKLIDIGHTDESAYQITPYEDNFLVSYEHIDSIRQHLYSGILEIDQYANIKRDRRFIDFSNNLNSIVIDTLLNKMFYTGEEFTLTNIPQSYRIYELDYHTLDSLRLVEVIDSNRIYPIIYQNLAIIHNGQLVVSGQGNTPDNHIFTAYLNLNTLDVDTLTHIGEPVHLYRSISAASMYTDKNGYLTYVTKTHRDTTTILRLDSNQVIYQIIKYFDGYNCFGARSYGCQLSDGRTVYNRCSEEDSSLPEIVFLADSTYEIVDKFEWTKNLPWFSPFFSSHGRRTYKLIEANNGDIIGIGASFWNEAPIPKPHFLNYAPLIFRINNKGDLLWYKAFYNLSEINDGVHGNLYGVTELPDGTIMAVGDIDSDIAFDSILGRPATVPDILIVRMTADGCIDGYDCESLLYKVPEVTRLTSGTQDTDVHDEGKMGIYIYPNPATDKLSIYIPTIANISTTQMNIEIFNTLGTKVMEQKVSDSQNSIDISSLSTGLHFIKIKYIDRTIVTSKFIKL